MLQGMGLEEILIWLLSFAIIFGILEQVQLPKSKGTRGIIAIVIAFFALFASVGSGLIEILSSMSVGLLLIILVIIVFIVFMESAGVKSSKFKRVGKDESGKTIHTRTKEGGNILQEHPSAFALALVIIAILIFVAAGGMNLLGFNISLGETSTMTLLFFGVIILAVVWMIANPGEKDGN